MVIMDEPTSAITEKEIQHLFEIINALMAARIIHYLSHAQNGRDIFHRRRGHCIARRQIHRFHATSQLTKEKLIQLMVGRDWAIYSSKPNPYQRGHFKRSQFFQRRGSFRDINFDVRRGEIFGLAGLVVEEETRLYSALFGATKTDGRGGPHPRQARDDKQPQGRHR
jgi:inositol transport system ATP-binding protein